MKLFSITIIVIGLSQKRKEISCYIKKIALDIEQNIELITREYEEKYPGISLKMKDYFNRFKTSSQRYNEELQKDWFEINYVARPEFARMHNYRIEIAEQYGISRRD